MADADMLARGDRLNKAVREFFAKGHRSGNKLYDESNTPSVNYSDLAISNPRSVNRLTHCCESQSHRIPRNANTDYQMAELLVKMPISDRSGNCYEMAALSNYYALKREFISRDLLYMMSITHPGDHVCCVISTVPIAGTRWSYPTVQSFANDNASRAYLMVDPWLNLVCSGEEYLRDGSGKLDKWSANGKRISWRGSQGSGWYPPGGEYKAQFAVAPVTLEPF